MGKETEYKLAVGDLQLLDCILCSRMVMDKLCAHYAYIRMRTTYYDTEDGFLAQRLWMLRLRTEDALSLIHICAGAVPAFPAPFPDGFPPVPGGTLRKGTKGGCINEYISLYDTHHRLMQILLFRAQGSSLECFREKYTDRSTEVVKVWFTVMQRKRCV